MGAERAENANVGCYWVDSGQETRVWGAGWGWWKELKEHKRKRGRKNK